MGTRSAFFRALFHLQDHPHACGDKVKWCLTDLKKKGSSPRVWGQGISFFTCFSPFRIIPTRVGTSSTLAFSVQNLKDHPHACGDKEYTKEVKIFNLGSSPRVWGQANDFRSDCAYIGIIPTRVGTR